MQQKMRGINNFVCVGLSQDTSEVVSGHPGSSADLVSIKTLELALLTLSFFNFTFNHQSSVFYTLDYDDVGSVIKRLDKSTHWRVQMEM